MNKIYSKREESKTPRLCFYLGLGIAFLAITCKILIQVVHIDIFKLFPAYSFYSKTGYYCFGCGGTRSVNALLHGEILESLRYHPIPLYVFFLYMAYMLSYILFVLTKGAIRYMRFRPIYFYVAIVVIIAQCIVKNYLLYRYGFKL